MRRKATGLRPEYQDRVAGLPGGNSISRAGLRSAWKFNTGGVIMRIFSRLSKNSRNGTRRIVTLSVVLLLSFCIVPYGSVSDVRAGGWDDIDAYGPLQFMRSQFNASADVPSVMTTIVEKFSIASDSTGIIFKRGRANVNNYLDGGSTILKTVVGMVFAPLFYCFRHPIIFFVAFFCLSVLFILMEHIMNTSKGDDFVSIDRRSRGRGKQYQNTAPHVLFMREKERRSCDNRKSLSDKQQVHI